MFSRFEIMIAATCYTVRIGLRVFIRCDRYQCLLWADCVEKLHLRKIVLKNRNTVRGEGAFANAISMQVISREDILLKRPTPGGHRVFQHGVMVWLLFDGGR